MDYLNIPADKSGFFPADGGNLYYRVNKARSGDGKTPLVAVHGGPGMSHDYLLPLLELTDERDVIFYDQIDSGRSDRPGNPASWTLESFTDELEHLRNALGLARIHLFSSSWGSSIAANYASFRPFGLDSLILSGALINTERWIADCTAYRNALPADVQATLDEYEAKGEFDNPEYLEAVAVFYKRHLCRKEPWPDCLKRTMDGANSDLYTYMWGPTEFLSTGTLKTLDLTPRLKNIEVPVLFINGEFDEGTPMSAEAFAKLVPNARTWVAKGCSHCPQIEDTESFIKTVQGFLQEFD